MRVLVSGGAGFIGSHLVEGLLADGHDVRVLDDLSTGSRKNLAAVFTHVEFLEGSCADPRAARRACRGIEAIHHLGAIPSVARSVASPILSHGANATATLTMLEAAREAGVRRFVYAGSSSVYGDNPRLPKRESMTPRPLSPYAVAKLAGEHYVRLYSRLFGMETLTLRYFNVFGPRQSPSSPYSGVISLFIDAVLGGRSPRIFGDGLQSRDFTFVDNVVRANLLALRAGRLAGEAVNVATGSRVTLLQVLDALQRLTGRTTPPVFSAARPGDIRHSLAALDRARELIGYRPVVGFPEGFRRTVDWYRTRATAGPGELGPRIREARARA